MPLSKKSRMGSHAQGEDLALCKWIKSSFVVTQGEVQSSGTVTEN